MEFEGGELFVNLTKEEHEGANVGKYIMTRIWEEYPKFCVCDEPDYIGEVEDEKQGVYRWVVMFLSI